MLATLDHSANAALMFARSAAGMLLSTAQVTVPPAVPALDEPHFAPSSVKSSAIMFPYVAEVDAGRSVGVVWSPVDETGAIRCSLDDEGCGRGEQDSVTHIGGYCAFAASSPSGRDEAKATL